VALPASLLESEIFGFEKGAFTGAIKAKPGILELADGGTLFLDEIAELDPALQAKLLRVLQERQFRRLGGTKMINVNIRIVSATNQNPEEALEQKKLRNDLYYRLNVVSISMPPLRNRIEDIPQLVQQFIDEFNPTCTKEITGISEDAMVYLNRYNWPGNVRELKNVIQQAMSLTENNVISINDLPHQVKKKNNLADRDGFQNMKYKEAKTKYCNQFSKAYFDNLLTIYDHNISKVAEVAGISRKTLYRILENLDYI
jgi:transcriptional regulator with PAS, ATPase and Fis domain